MLHSRSLTTATFLMLLVLVAVTTVASCASSSAARVDPREAVVVVRLHTDGYQIEQTGTSLGNGQVVTFASWRDGPAPSQVEVLWGSGNVAEADIAKIDKDFAIALLRTRQASPPGLGDVARLGPGDKATLVGREVTPGGPAPTATPAGVPPLREIDGTVAAAGVALPDPRAFPPPGGPRPSGSFVEVQAAAWGGLTGGLVLDSQGRPAAVVLLVQVMSTGAPAPCYALPLDEVKSWASR